jgi:hypothetical protein
VGTLLFGAHVGERAGLREKLVTNQERFQFICTILDNESVPMADRFAAIAEVVTLIDSYRFVPETGLLLETMVGAVQRAAKGLLSCSDTLEPLLKQHFENLAAAPRSPDSYEALGALHALIDANITVVGDPRSPLAITHRLAKVVWDYTFMHYFWLEKQRTKGSSKGEPI